ncbi:MAG: hypothetical protein JWR15_1937, partial [Prosthecobacter sp.]|nr:hypothetical protein [Prosthecobacter sp.]
PTPRSAPAGHPHPHRETLESGSCDAGLRRASSRPHSKLKPSATMPGTHHLSLRPTFSRSASVSSLPYIFVFFRGDEGAAVKWRGGAQPLAFVIRSFQNLAYLSDACPFQQFKPFHLRPVEERFSGLKTLLGCLDQVWILAQPRCHNFATLPLHPILHQIVRRQVEPRRKHRHFVRCTWRGLPYDWHAPNMHRTGGGGKGILAPLRPAPDRRRA